MVHQCALGRGKCEKESWSANLGFLGQYRIPEQIQPAEVPLGEQLGMLGTDAITKRTGWWS